MIELRIDLYFAQSGSRNPTKTGIPRHAMNICSVKGLDNKSAPQLQISRYNFHPSKICSTRKCMHESVPGLTKLLQKISCLHPNFTGTIRHRKVHHDWDLQFNVVTNMVIDIYNKTWSIPNMNLMAQILQSKILVLTRPIRQAFSWKSALSLIIWLIICSTAHIT